jgi:hypothetical protein
MTMMSHEVFFFGEVLLFNHLCYSVNGMKLEGAHMSHISVSSFQFLPSCWSFFTVLNVLIGNSFFDFKEIFKPCSGFLNREYGDSSILMRVRVFTFDQSSFMQLPKERHYSMGEVCLWLGMETDM